MSQIDVAIIGAGVAGLTCGRVLQQAGYRVVLLEKSRGVGGRLATRRLHETRADHGSCYLSPKGELFRELIEDLVEEGVVKVWTDCVYGFTPEDGLYASTDRRDRIPRYVAPEGMNAIAKYLSSGLNIQFNQRAIALTLTRDRTWQITLENTHPDSANNLITTNLEAKAVIVTVPAPQAIALLESLAPKHTLATSSLDSLRKVAFNPCIAVMAGYTEAHRQDWQTRYPEVSAIALTHPDLAWIGLDSSKRTIPSTPVFVVQSSAAFAETTLDCADVNPLGKDLLNSAADLLAPWLRSPTWMQVHRWRYALSSRPLGQKFWTAETAAPLLCAGDWCTGMKAENALIAGVEVADAFNRQMGEKAITRFRFWRSQY
jgi:renalase